MTTTSPSPARTVLVVVQRVQYIEIEVSEGFDLYGLQASVDSLTRRALDMADDEIRADLASASLIVEIRDGDQERTVRD